MGRNGIECNPTELNRTGPNRNEANCVRWSIFSSFTSDQARIEIARLAPPPVAIRQSMTGEVARRKFSFSLTFSFLFHLPPCRG